MNAIGGYFELELNKGQEYHPDAIGLNTARSALELILKNTKYKKVYIPFFTCSVILEPFKKTNTLYEFYSIDKNLEPIFDFFTLKYEEAFLYTNYFGLKDVYIATLAENCKNLIIDNSQSFYSLPQKNISTFYSCRKFFGLPDGAYLYSNFSVENDFPLDYSDARFIHLIKRIEYGAEAGYNDFNRNRNDLSGQPIKKMSNLTKALLCNIDYEIVRKKRIENFRFLNDHLSKSNELEINLNLNDNSVPMVYPYLTSRPDLKQKLINKKIYLATYWPNVADWVNKDSIEYKYSQQILYLPMDQRYNFENLNDIIFQLL